MPGGSRIWGGRICAGGFLFIRRERGSAEAVFQNRNPEPRAEQGGAMGKVLALKFLRAGFPVCRLFLSLGEKKPDGPENPRRKSPENNVAGETGKASSAMSGAGIRECCAGEQSEPDRAGSSWHFRDDCGKRPEKRRGGEMRISASPRIRAGEHRNDLRSMTEREQARLP